MFTVIIAEKEYIDKLEEYKLFLKPFLSNRELAFCEWHTDKTSFAEMLPTLASEVGRRKDWRAILICDEKGISQQNPFDLVNLPAEKYEGPLHGVDPTTETGETDTVYQQYLEAEHQKKLHAYTLAAENPLTRLVTFLCDDPTVTVTQTETLSKNDPGYGRYVAQVQKKAELRANIRGDEVIETAQPKEILCVARRTYCSAADEFETVWSSHSELEYSRFYDRNLYFDKMRYLVFDILPKTQRDYSFDYIRFLYATLVLGAKELPAGSLVPERVYRLECENDEAALKRLLQTYEYKMNVTKEELLQKIRDIEGKKPRLLRDKEVQQIFSAQATPAVLDADFDVEPMYAAYQKIGFADGCPTDVAIFWNGEYKRSQKTLFQLLKLSRRAVKRAARETRCQQEEALDDALLLNEFQLEDVQERINNQELEMLRTNLVDLYSEKAFLEDMEEDDKNIQKKIETRMYRRTTIAVGVIAALLFSFGFLSLFYHNASSNVFNFSTGLIITGVAVGAFIVVAAVALFFLRNALVERFKDFNETMHTIHGRISGGMAQYTKYLTHVYNVRRGYAVLEAAEKLQNPDAGKVILYKKHICDIEAAKAAVRDIFGQFMEDAVPFDRASVLPYEYNYDRPTEYVYPLPYTEGTCCHIQFMQADTKTDVPVDFMKSLTVRREELYE